MRKFKTDYQKLAYYSFLILMLAIQSCSKGDAKMAVDPQPPNECDLSNVTFSSTVWPIISANCTSCHSGANPENNLRLEDYNTVKAQASIPAGSPGSLIGAITHSSGNFPMPTDQTKLSDCNISKINKWIQNGMPNN